jgi:hypothetical protein
VYFTSSVHHRVVQSNVERVWWFWGSDNRFRSCSSGNLLRSGWRRGWRRPHNGSVPENDAATDNFVLEVNVEETLFTW